MVHALGYSSTAFKPSAPGRLCRGRERWIPGWEEETQEPLWRLVISGAAFSDDSARDAERGLSCVAVDVGELLEALFPKATLLAFREEGMLGELPDYVDASDAENAFLQHRHGGETFDRCMRWRALVNDPVERARLVSQDLVDGFVVLGEGQTLTKELDDALFLLTGQGDASEWPVQRFQPLAVREVLQHCEALICLHVDKHGPALGVYTLEPLERDAEIRGVLAGGAVLPVPFAIPPMLARWDRALQELRTRWMREREDEFPVPPADEPTRWSRGRRRRRRDSDEE